MRQRRWKEGTTGLGLTACSSEEAEISTAQQGHRRQASSIYSQYPSTPGLPQSSSQAFQPSQQPALGFPGYGARAVPPSTQASQSFQEKVRSYEDTVEISPPSSPEMSPIHVPQLTGPTTSMSFMPSSPPRKHLPITTKKAESGIPVMRREKKQAEMGRKPVGGGTRAVSAAQAIPSSSSYDPYSTRDAGNKRNFSANQSNLADNQWETVNTLADYNTLSSSPVQTYSAQKQQTPPTVTNLEGMYGAPYAKQPTQSFTDRVRKIRDGAGTKKAPIPTAQRPDWKGGSGRMAIVPAPEDNPYVAPLQIPRKSSKRVPSLPSMNSSRAHTPRSNTPKTGTPKEKDVVESPLSQVTAKPQNYFAHNAPPARTSSANVVPKKAEVLKYDDTYEDRFADNSIPPSPLDSLPSQKNRSVSNLGLNATQRTESGGLPPSVSTIERNFDTALSGVKVFSSSPPHQKHYPNEVSRFSVTTYAPSTTGNSPRMSTDSAPPMPDINQTKYRNPSLYSTSNASQHSVDSILNRKRPVAPSTHTFDRTTAELERPNLPRDTTLKVLAIREHKAETGKALPKSPLELNQADKCLALQAQLDDLELQKQNIERSIDAMTKLIPSEMTGLPPGLGTEGRRIEMARRENEKKKVEGLRAELANVKKLEQETGIKLHRALRKRDETGGYEPSGLWVRRVTG